ncbi:MAG: radical SAM protein [Candidatus Omnitrophota bacterium]|nr:radical SAM protein [Candidatus Omnitrophota bacterium]
MDNLRIDSHKLIYHVERVAKWKNGDLIAPIYMEIAPSGGCNHRCIFCALDYIGYKPRFLDTGVLKTVIKDSAKYGVKSVMYAGEGEPLLHKDIVDIIGFTKHSGLDVSITTNGVFLNGMVIKNCLKDLSWVRVSFNAGSPEAYQKIHRGRKGDFEKVISNLEQAVSFKKKNKLSCVIGAQMLLIPENTGEVIKLARILKKIGVDYFTVKPFSKHPMSYCNIKKGFDYGKFAGLEKSLGKLAAKDFRIIFRSHTMEKLKEGRFYRHCLGLPFWAYISAEGDVYACSAYLGNKKFMYGNVYKNKFLDIMKGKRRQAILKMAATELDTSKCREVCRLDEINRYLWELKNPGPHVNFI